MRATGAIVEIDLARIGANVRGIAQRVGVPVYAVVKADAYGLGAIAVAEAIAPLVDGFCVFALHEAVQTDLWRRTGKEIITLGPPESHNPQDYIAHHVRPAVATVDQAEALRSTHPLLCVDTGMQRFACPAEQIEAVIRAGDIHEAFTHATRREHVRMLVGLLGGRGINLHAAGSKLLDDSEAWLDAVRPGIAMYRDAITVWAPLVEVHQTRGLAGYSGFASQRHGVILCGYRHGLRKGPCDINGQRRQILEVGMQSAYVEIGDRDCVGDAVMLMGGSLEPDEIARAWHSTPHEVLLRLGGAGPRR